MLSLSLVFFGAMLLLVVVQTIVAMVYINLIRQANFRCGQDGYLPQAAVVLAIRGPDPNLSRTLDALLSQDYPSYGIHLVVDSPQDAALPIIESALSNDRTGRIELQFLKTPRTTCSLKCSALAEAVEAIGHKYEVLAFTDGDAMLPRNWLREIVSPLRDESVGVANGNRWFLPIEGKWGSLVRFYWNAAAIVQVWLNGIVWAGSMAMRTRVIHDIGLVEEWRKSLSVDSTIARVIKNTRYRVQFVPTALLANTEETNLQQFFRWVRRQMVAGLSSKRGRVGIILHGYSLALLQLIPAILLLVGAATNDWRVVSLNSLGLAAYWGSGFVLATGLDRSIRQLMHEREEEYPKSKSSVRMRMFPAMLITNIVYPIILSSALFIRHVEWRGVRYQLCPGGKVKMLGYAPFKSVDVDLKDSVV